MEALIPDEAEFLRFRNMLANPRLGIWEIGALIPSEEDAVQACYAWGLIPTRCACLQCGSEMRVQNHPSMKLGYRWRCRKVIEMDGCRIPCNTTQNPLEGTFFEKVQISILQVIRLLCHFLREDKVTVTSNDVKITRKTGIDFYSFFREACDVVQDHDQRPLGGPQDVIEVDETHLFTRKYHRGRLLQLQKRQFWVFGILSRLNSDMWVEQIPDKTRVTLDRIVRGKVRPQSWIMSDYHRSYINIDQRLNLKGHGRVNHKRRFVEGVVDIMGVRPRLGISVRGSPGVRRVKVHINNIERSWRELKKKVRTCRSPPKLNGYIGEFLYRRNVLRHESTFNAKMRRFITDVGRLYPGLENYRTRIRRPGHRCQCVSCN